MCLVSVPYRIAFQSASGVGGPGHHVHRDLNLCDYFVWGYHKDCVYRTNLHTVQEL